MADTPRGPRPTRTRRTVLGLLIGWALVLACVLTVALAPRLLLADGWSRERVTITHLPYADCEDGRCVMHPTIELPDGSSRRLRLDIRHQDELLPSQHFDDGGSILLWIPDHDSATPRSLRPIEPRAETIMAAAAVTGALLACLLGYRAFTARRWHDERNAGHLTDHAAVFAAPAIVLVAAITLAVMHDSWRTPRHDPEPPARADATAVDR